MYRGVIVKLSLRYRLLEEKIAKGLSGAGGSGKDGLHCSHHVGAYLLGKGYPLLKAKELGKQFRKRSGKNGMQ